MLVSHRMKASVVCLFVWVFVCLFVCLFVIALNKSWYGKLAKIRLRFYNYQYNQTNRKTFYTLAHPENDGDVTERAQGCTPQGASFMRQSRCSFLNAWENTQVVRAMKSVFLQNTRWRHGLSRGETKYRDFMHDKVKPIRTTNQ